MRKTRARRARLPIEIGPVGLSAVAGTVVEQEHAICREYRVAAGLSIKLKWSVWNCFPLPSPRGHP